jgi:c-di-GMP-binding flagellar brake protein YcgR
MRELRAEWEWVRVSSSFVGASARCNMNGMNPADRRLSQRYFLKDEVYLVFRPDFRKIGRLKDISNGGIAVEYPVYEAYEKATEVEVDIFSSRNHLILRSVACKVVYDVKVDRKPKTRRCGLKFEHPISELHRKPLQELLIHYTLSSPL